MRIKLLSSNNYGPYESSKLTKIGKLNEMCTYLFIEDTANPRQPEKNMWLHLFNLNKYTLSNIGYMFSNYT